MSHLGHACSRLESAFFLMQDKELMDKLRHESSQRETKEALKQVSGIDNDVVLDKLIELKVRPEVVASLSLVPLVAVAWADGFADDQEKEAIMAASQHVGLVKGEIDYELLSRWLDRQPGPELMEAWTYFVRALCKQLTPEERELLKEEIIADSTAVAAASGGFLGIHKISRSERRKLDELEQVFDDEIGAASEEAPAQ